MKKILAQTISFMLIAASLTACTDQSPDNLSGTQSESKSERPKAAPLTAPKANQIPNLKSPPVNRLF